MDWLDHPVAAFIVGWLVLQFLNRLKRKRIEQQAAQTRPVEPPRREEASRYSSSDDDDVDDDEIWRDEETDEEVMVSSLAMPKIVIESSLASVESDVEFSESVPQLEIESGTSRLSTSRLPDSCDRLPFEFLNQETFSETELGEAVEEWFRRRHRRASDAQRKSTTRARRADPKAQCLIRDALLLDVIFSSPRTMLAPKKRRL